MAHGGKRAGAGRTPLLTEEDRIWLGAKCENRWNEAHLEEARKRVREQEARLHARKGMNIREHIRSAQAEALEELRAASGFERLRDPTPLGDEDSDHPLDDKVLNVRTWIQEYESQLITYPNAKAMGKKKEIIQTVAAEASADFGLDVKPSFVDDCWKEYRALLKSWGLPSKEPQT